MNGNFVKFGVGRWMFWVVVTMGVARYVKIIWIVIVMMFLRICWIVVWILVSWFA